MENDINNTQEVLTKKEKREMRREERHQEVAAGQRSRTTQRIIKWVAVIGGLGLVVFGLSKMSGNAPVVSSGTLPAPISDSDWSTGKKDSSVVLVEYGDYQCPACGAYYPILKQLIKDFPNMRFVFRNFPLKDLHQHAELSAWAAEAAGKEGKFWEMHDLLYDNQAKWAGMSNTGAETTFVGYAKILGLSETQFKSDLYSDAIKKRVSNDYNVGLSAGINATPTFYVNGKQIDSPQGYEPFKTIISDAFKQSQPK